MKEQITRLSAECSEFLSLSRGLPLIKALPADGEFIRKVKVRKKKSSDDFVSKFNSAFDDMYNNLYGRSIFCNGEHAESTLGKEQFYVFPINGFSFLFNPSVSYHKEYQELYEKMIKYMPVEECQKVFVDIISYSYKESNVNLNEAILTKKEIILFGIPYYYAIRVDRFPDYTVLLNDLKQV